MTSMTTTNPVRRHAGLRRGLGAVAVALTVLVAAAGCGTGQDAETSQIVPAIPGADADAGPVALRDLLIPYREGGYPAGSAVPLVVRMFSTAERPITVSAVTPGSAGFMTVPATDVAVRPAGTGLVIPPNGDLLLVPGAGPYLMAEHIDGPLSYGQTLPVRVTFNTGDSVTVDVPMAPPDYPTAG